MDNWRARVLLVLIAWSGCLIALSYTRSHFKSERQIILLNTTRPDFRQFLNIEKNHTATFSKNRLKAYFEYFHLVTEAIPDNNEGLLMLGYLENATGDIKQALIFWEKAHRLDPSFFFTEYDLALADFGQGQYLQSMDLLKNALAIPPQATFNRMMHSIIYRQLFSSLDDNRDIIIGLQQAYHDAYLLLMASLAMQKRSQGENIVPPDVYAHVM